MSHGGYIYAIGIQGTSYIKIGSTTRSLKQRLHALQTAHPLPLVPVACIAVESRIGKIERYIHSFLDAARQQGEWFDIAMDTERLARLVAQAVDFLVVEEARQQATSSVSGKDDKLLGHRLAILRHARRLSQTKVAEEIGITQKHLSQIERGKSSFLSLSSGIVVKLADLLGVSTDYLLGRTDEKSEPEPTDMALVAP